MISTKPQEKRIHTHVDDVSQLAIGNKVHVIDTLTKRLGLFCGMSESLKFTVSSKSCTVASDLKIAELVSAEAKKLGLSLSALKCNRDVGIALRVTAGKYRDRSIDKDRWIKKLCIGWTKLCRYPRFRDLPGNYGWPVGVPKRIGATQQ